MSTYAGEPGGTRDPATPGGYCLAICWCGTCPQHARQKADAEALRRAEYQRRLANESERAARQAKRARTHTYGGSSR